MFIVYQKVLMKPDGSRLSNQIYVSDDTSLEQFQNEERRVGWVWIDETIAKRGEDQLYIHRVFPTAVEAHAYRLKFPQDG